jgi:hypothetical protein
MLSGRQFKQLTIIISIARIQLILQLNRLRTAVDQLTRKIIIARMLSSNNKIVSSRFFEQMNFEQLIMTLFHNIKIICFQRLFDQNGGFQRPFNPNSNAEENNFDKVYRTDFSVCTYVNKVSIL